MNKKGFTLIELLAVIVILAIIALIATPIITGIVANVKKGGAESSALGWIDAVEKQSMVNMLDDNSNTLTDGTYNVSDLDIKVKGEKPKSGWVKIEQGQVKDYSLVIGEYTVTPKDNNPSKAIAVKGSKSDTIIYRYSNNVLYNGDKIDLKSRKITNLKRWDSNSKKYVSINETYDMVGIYSTKLEDVLNVTTSFDGKTITARDNTVYLKHTVNGEGIIIKSETCLKTSWGTLCQVGAESEYDESRNLWIDPSYNSKKDSLLDYFKYNSETNASGYNGPTASYSDYVCSTNQSATDCTSMVSIAKVVIDGSVTSYDDYTNSFYCGIKNNGKSFCGSSLNE